MSCKLAGTTLISLSAALADINASLDENEGRLDERSLSYLSDVEQRSRNRLEFYQYQLIKAFEYRILSEAPDALLTGLTELFDTIERQ